LVIATANEVVLVSRYRLSIHSGSSLILRVLGECGLIHLETTSALRLDLLEVLIRIIDRTSCSRSSANLLFACCYLSGRIVSPANLFFTDEIVRRRVQNAWAFLFRRLLTSFFATTMSAIFVLINGASEEFRLWCGASITATLLLEPISIFFAVIAKLIF